MPTEELFGAYHFLLEIQGVINDNKIIVGGFKSVAGMDTGTPISYLFGQDWEHLGDFGYWFGPNQA